MGRISGAIQCRSLLAQRSGAVQLRPLYWGKLWPRQIPSSAWRRALKQSNFAPSWRRGLTPSHSLPVQGGAVRLGRALAQSNSVFLIVESFVTIQFRSLMAERPCSIPFLTPSRGRGQVGESSGPVQFRLLKRGARWNNPILLPHGKVALLHPIPLPLRGRGQVRGWSIEQQTSPTLLPQGKGNQWVNTSSFQARNTSRVKTK
jgi:hypothetical protein